MNVWPPLLLTCLALSFAGTSARAAEPVALRGETMGTTYTVRAILPADGVRPAELQARIDRRLETVNDQMSTWRDDSEISRFNRRAGTDWFPVSADTARVVAAALEVSRSTGGAFDVTVKPLIDLWRFGEDGTGRTELPTDAEIAAARKRVGYRHLHARLDPPALKKDIPDLTINLSAIAKGYGVDVVARALDEAGVSAYMVEIGGEIRTRGTKPGGAGWRIGIEAPVPGVRRLHRAVELRGESMATSGDYRNFYDLGGRRYSHTIDPRTGRPVEHAAASVTVVTDDCMTADAAATAVMALGPDAGYNWAVGRDLAVLILTRNGRTVSERATPAFQASFPNPAKTPGNGMTTTWLIALGVFLAAMILMAVGVIFSNRRIKGSCGGLANLRDERGRPMCMACSHPDPECGGVTEGHARDEGFSEAESGSDRHG